MDNYMAYRDTGKANDGYFSPKTNLQTTAGFATSPLSSDMMARQRSNEIANGRKIDIMKMSIRTANDGNVAK